MYLRWATATSGGVKRRYAQLVEGYRVAGKRSPRIRVLLGLGEITQQQYDNLAVALAASRRDERVVPIKAARLDPQKLKPSANLRYADLALLLRVAEQEGLMEIVASACHDELACKLIWALVCQRCVEPASKLEAVRWIPTSALPELLGIALARVNNTQFHRVLSQLEQATAGLQARLATHYHKAGGGFSALFIDNTDTWFVGRGPPNAAKGKTKEGLVRRKIGITMLCNQNGYPIRWATFSGAESDHKPMTAMAQQIARLPWMQETPLVCDRAMGKPAILQQLLGAGIRVVTALPRSDAAHLGIDTPIITADGRDASAAVQQVLKEGFVRVNETMYVRELPAISLCAVEQGEAPAPDEDIGDNHAARTLKLTRQLADGVRNGLYPSDAAAARANGLKKQTFAEYKKMLRLPEDIQQEILDGRYPGLTLAATRRLAELDGVAALREQLTGYRVASKRSNRRRKRATSQPKLTGETDSQNEPQRHQEAELRVVAYFNPSLFEQKRRNAAAVQSDIEQYVAELNASQLSGKSRRNRDSLYSAVEAKLRKYDLLTAFCWQVDETAVPGTKRACCKVTLVRNDQEWAKRRRYDGFTLVVAHSSISNGAEHLAQLYRSKDLIEKDFQTIKSVAELRPVRHHTEIKVAAHVTLCVLALLLERVLARRLDDGKLALSPQRTLGELANCYLNLFERAAEPVYVATEPSKMQREILTALKFGDIVDDAAIAERTVPRHS